ncbi:MAG: sterol desaturase family protein [Rhodanobacter sp.]|jgi:sterol desaturase/sphingolipid hydroxylase (fatty acid hydroxylase superfamily)
MSQHSKREAACEVIWRAVKPVLETRELLHADGELKPELGQVSGVIALSLGFVCLLAVLAFHFPLYLTTPDLRRKYSVDVLRQALLLGLLVADLAQYWTHRAYHEIPFLWRFHSVHHSVKTMDWLAGSRRHILELILTRVCVLAPLYILSFSEAAMNGYIPIVGFQAVFNHANVHLPWGLLKYVITHRISTTGTTPPTTRRSTATTPRTMPFSTTCLARW